MNDVNVPYSQCEFTTAPAWLGVPCNDTATVVCARRYVYIGQTDCDNDADHTNSVRQYEVTFNPACAGTAGSAGIPNW